jgi:hypothetical protein
MKRNKGGKVVDLAFGSPEGKVLKLLKRKMSL